jgi:hypothetical protein
MHKEHGGEGLELAWFWQASWTTTVAGRTTKAMATVRALVGMNHGREAVTRSHTHPQLVGVVGRVAGFVLRMLLTVDNTPKLRQTLESRERPEDHKDAQQHTAEDRKRIKETV